MRIFKYIFILNQERYVQRFSFYHHIYKELNHLDTTSIEEFIIPIPRLLQQLTYSTFFYNFHSDYFYKLYYHVIFLLCFLVLFFLDYYPIYLLIIPLSYISLCIIINVIVSFIEIKKMRTLLLQCYEYYEKKIGQE